MTKYLISLILIFLLFSCNELNLNNVSDVVENSTNKIEEIIDNTKEDKKEKNLSNNKQTKDNIFGIDLRLTAPQPFGLTCFIESKKDEEIFFGGSTSLPQVLSLDHGFLSNEVK